MNEKSVVFVCMVERCENSKLYRKLCGVEGIDVRNSSCRGYCSLGSRVDVYANRGNQMFAERLPENPNLNIEALGDDPVGKIMEYARKV